MTRLSRKDEESKSKWLPVDDWLRDSINARLDMLEFEMALPGSVRIARIQRRIILHIAQGPAREREALKKAPLEYGHLKHVGPLGMFDRFIEVAKHDGVAIQEL